MVLKDHLKADQKVVLQKDHLKAVQDQKDHLKVVLKAALKDHLRVVLKRDRNLQVKNLQKNSKSSDFSGDFSFNSISINYKLHTWIIMQ